MICDDGDYDDYGDGDDNDDGDGDLQSRVFSTFSYIFFYIYWVVETYN